MDTTKDANLIVVIISVIIFKFSKEFLTPCEHWEGFSKCY